MEEYQGAFYCYEEWSPLFDPLTGGQNYTIVQFALFYALPLFVITVLYTFLSVQNLEKKRPWASSTWFATSSNSFSGQEKTFKIAYHYCLCLCRFLASISRDLFPSVF